MYDTDVLGAAYKCLRPSEETADITQGTEDARWAGLGNRTLVAHADQLLAHLAR